MSAGSVLLQPQRVRRATAPDPAAAILADLRILVEGVIADGREGGAIAALAAEAMEGLAARFIARGEGGLERAQERLEAMVRPVLDALQARLAALLAVDDLPALADALEGLLEDLVGLAEGLTIEGIRGPLDELVDIVERDLGLGPAFLEEQVLALLDDLVARLEAAPAGAAPSARRNRRDVAAALRRIRRRLPGELQIPELDPDRLAGELLALARRSGVEEGARRAACVGRGLLEGLRAGTGVLAAVPFSGFGAGSVGAASRAPSEETYCWYLTWLLEGKQPFFTGLLSPAIGGDEVWVEPRNNRVVRRNRLRDDVVLCEGVDWRQASVLQPGAEAEELEKNDIEGPYVFGRVDADTCEMVAWISAIVVNGLEALANLISLEEGDYASNALNAFWNTAFAIQLGVQRKPLPHWFDVWIARTLSTFFCSLEGTHSRVSAGNWFLMWLTLVGPDLGEVVIYRSAFSTLRDLLLSTITLLNHQPPATAAALRPENRNEVDGVTAVFDWLAGELLMLLVPKQDYGVPNQGADHAVRLLVFWDLLGGAVFGLLGGFLGTLMGHRILAGADDFAPLGGRMLKSMVSSVLLFVPSLYMSHEGDTDEGTYNPSGEAFAGYPARASSPYRLPYASGASEYVGQANQGFFSHYFLNGAQIYAYDFSMDQDDVILASRAGTVVDFFDWVPDDQDVRTSIPTGVTGVPGQTATTNWNFIVLRHDVDDAGNLLANPDPVHDLGPGGTPSFTYCIYGHGRMNSVRQIFATKLGIPFASITPAQILNVAAPVTVRRGEPIMGAGDTGISFHNHLHQMVQIEGGTSPGPRGRRRNGAFTIPFVFGDVDGDGVPQHFNFYRSGNA